VPEPITQALLAHGVLGVVVAALGWYVYRKDAELTAERAARIEDAKAYNELSLKLQGQILEAVNKLSDVFDEVKKMMAQKGRY
jgi:lipopolysaccharide biosynthesis regulator YciM